MTQVVLSKNRDIIKKALLFLIIIIAIFSALLVNILHRDFNRDEFESLHSAWEISKGAKIYVDFFQNHNPLLYYILVPFIKFSGENIRTIFLGRLIIFCFFLLTIWATYLLGKVVFDKDIALSSSLILSTTPLFVQKAIEIKPDISMVACIMISIYFLFLYIRFLKTFTLILSAIFSGIAILFLQKAVPLTFFIYLILLYKIIKKEVPLKACLLFIIAFLMSLIPFFLYLYFMGMLQAYWEFPIKFTMLWLGNHSHKLTFINYFFQWLNPLLIFFYGLGLIFFLETEDQKILGFFSFAAFLSIFVNALIAPQYYMPILPFTAIITATVLHKGFKKQNIAFIALCFILAPQLYRNYKIGLKLPGCKPTLNRIQYVLDHTNFKDYVYDGHASFNIYRKDIDFFWFVLDYRYGALFVYKNLTPYNYDIYSLIQTKKPKIISNHLLNMNDKRISRYYLRVPQYRGLYLLNGKAIKTLALFKKWKDSHNPTYLKSVIEGGISCLNAKQLSEIGDYYLHRKDWDKAIYWFEAANKQNPICRDYLEALIVCFKKTNQNQRIEEISDKLKNLQQIRYGPYLFEDGGSLEAFHLIPEVIKGNPVKLGLFVHPPSTFRGCTVFLSFFRNGNFYFGKDINLPRFKATGELYSFEGEIPIPKNVPTGIYNVYFTFRIPLRDYRYHLFRQGKLLKKNKILLSKLKLINP